MKSKEKNHTDLGNSEFKGTVKRDHLFNLVLKYLKEKIDSQEMSRLLKNMGELFQKGDQITLDFITQKIEIQDESLLTHWTDFKDIFCSTLGNLKSHQQEELQAVLFLVPVVVSIEPQTNGEDDFELVQSDVVSELMVKAGMISNGEENTGILPPLFSMDEVNSINETTRHQLMRSFVFPKVAQRPPLQDIRQPIPLNAAQLELKLKFMIGVATLKGDDEESPLSRLLDPDGSYPDDQVENDLSMMETFLEELSGKIPESLKEKKGIELTTQALAVYNFDRLGIESSINDFDEFKLSIIFKQSELIENPRIQVSQKEGTPLQVTLFDEHKSIFTTDLNCLFDSKDELNEFFDDLLRNLEFRGFVSESQNEGSASFVKKPFSGYTLN